MRNGLRRCRCGVGRVFLFKPQEAFNARSILGGQDVRLQGRDALIVGELGAAIIGFSGEALETR